MKKRWFYLLCVLLTLLLASACGDGEQGKTAQDTPDAGDAGAAQPADQAGILSQFAATDLDGNEIDQSILEGYDLTMVNIWATFCQPCIREMPDLGELADVYAEKGIQFVGLVSDVLNADGSLSDSQVETAREIVDTTGAGYLHILPSEDLFGLLSQVSAVPTTLFVDSEGKQVGTAFARSLTREEWEETLDAMLEEVQADEPAAQ